MNIYILTTESFPNGMAATNRIISYGRGFIANNAGIKIICLKANQYPDTYKGKDVYRGIYKKIKYEYAPGTCIRGKSFYKRRWLGFYGIIRTIYLLFSENKKNRIDAAILFSNDPLYMIVFYFVTKLLKIKYIQEKSEYPFVLKLESMCGKLYAKFYINMYKLFDGLLVENKNLYNYFQDKINSKADLLIIPTTINSEDILNEKVNIKEKDYIFYCGTLSRDKKDGLHILIKAFAKLLPVYPDIYLYISGTGPQKEIFFYKSIAKQLSISNRVIFLGNVSRKELVYYLKNAKILALAKESNKIQSGGLSSKVIEYLYTGNPIVLTELGEITAHLENGKNVFFAKPDNVDSFEEILRYVLDNYDFAKNVGENGQNLAIKEFDYIKQTKRIINFIDKL